ncbi:vacuolar transporter chaperone complex subunit 2-like isoform X1 [Branchiostoma lanceolatum]|uniref:vacuolar transporter chaperone complex subunit 2-like isoform X1 n=1 Tax=Branchiostoma lanceolatum TaxID=7740 RepID=UPI0034568D26
MDRPGSSFNMGSSLPGQVNGGFDMTDGNEITVTSLSGSRIATRQTWEDGIEAFSDPDRMEKGKPAFKSFTEEHPPDPSTVSAMERTLAAFMNQGLLLVGIGTALMTFNQHGPNIVGWVMVPAGVLHIVWSWYEFYIRLHWLRKGSDQALSYRRSLWWTGALVVLIVAASIVELYGNIMYGAFVVVTFPDGEGQGLPTTPTP